MHKYELRVPPPESFPLPQPSPDRSIPTTEPQIMQLELALALPAAGDLISELRLPAENRTGRKRGVDQMFDKITLPLFMHKEDEEEEEEDLQELNSGGGGRVLVGWPPLRSSRRRANCVKVNMEGVAIGRKVDLSLHDSYQDLFRTLNSMFPTQQHEIGDNAAYYKVTYEDEDGDWMLVGDVPWETFIQAVKRLKILN